jgi:hypothetical protein
VTGEWRAEASGEGSAGGVNSRDYTYQYSVSGVWFEIRSYCLVLKQSRSSLQMSEIGERLRNSPSTLVQNALFGCFQSASAVLDQF